MVEPSATDNNSVRHLLTTKLSLAQTPLGSSSQKYGGYSKPALRMIGLPYSVTHDDILQFFHGMGVIEDSIKIGRYADGKTTGEAAVVFDSADDAQLAYNEKYKQYIGSRFIELFLISSKEHQDFLVDAGERDLDRPRGGRGGRGGQFESRGGRGARGGRGGRSRGDYVNRGGRNEESSFRGGRGYYTPRGGSYRGSEGPSSYSVAHHDDTHDVYGKDADLADSQEVQFQKPQQKSSGFVRLNDYITEVNKTSCVKIRGLPWTSTVKEIREFFADFRIRERDIIIDKSHGQPTGYALVFLESIEEAERAKKELDRQYVGSRYVDVFQPDSKN